MRKILKKSTIVLVMLTFILAMVNINGVNTSFADTKDSTQTIQRLQIIINQIAQVVMKLLQPMKIIQKMMRMCLKQMMDLSIQ